MKYLIYLAMPFLIYSFSSCTGPVDKNNNKKGDSAEAVKPLLPNNFNSDSAYLFIEKQVSFGPRVPNTEAHRKCAKWMETMLSKWADTVFVQEFDAKSYKNETWKAKNIIGAFNPKNKKRILLCAHWDTRPEADQDATDKNTPSDGANDGGSGVGVLLEIARQIHELKPELGIDIVFFDVEDGGTNSSDIKDTWCLGSQYWAKNPHVPYYKAKNGILLDMVGAKDATFAREDMSAQFDNNFLSTVWQTAASLQFGNYFINYSKSGITDDHVYVSYYANIPTIDIIDYSSKTESGFGDYWHTHKDNMSIIDRKTLNAVGKTVLQTVFNMEANIVN